MSDYQICRWLVFLSEHFVSRKNLQRKICCLAFRLDFGISLPFSSSPSLDIICELQILLEDYYDKEDKDDYDKEDKDYYDKEEKDYHDK